MDDQEKDRLGKASDKRLLTSEEQAELDAWYSSFDGSGEGLKVFRNSEHEEEVRVRLLNKILAKISAKRLSSDSSGPRRKTFNWRKVAAVFAFFILAFPLYKYMETTDEVEIVESRALTVREAGTGRILEVRLPDGSEISLNAGSVIQYPERFTGDKREIYLEGEAFFKVVPDPNKPFIVHTGKITTRVLGTSFNVSAYPGIGQVKVTVVTGKVGVASRGNSFAVLRPNEQMSYHAATDRYEVSKTKTSRADSWRFGEVRLDGVSFDELSLTIKNTWGYLLETKSAQLQAANYKTTFHRNHTIEDVMRVISKITNATYQIRDNIITLDE